MLSLLFLYPVLVTCNVGSSPTVCFPKACFTWYPERLVFQESVKKCEDYGGSVPTIRDQGELNDLQSVVWQLPENHHQLWIGLWLPKGKCTFPALSLRGFEWISGNKTSDFSNWKLEPETTCTEERCVTVKRSSNPNLEWTDSSCKGRNHYLCRFKFKGMCPPLFKTGTATVDYWLPFLNSSLSQDNALTYWPHGSYAEISCEASAKPTYTICQGGNGLFSWKPRGPYCSDHRVTCNHDNGGCTQLCIADETGVHCGCRQGYQLEEDNASCTISSDCGSAPCQYRCLPQLSGFLCTCPKGFQLASDQISCVDIDECSVSPPCGKDVCRNTNGSYTCQCMDGFVLTDGQCRDIDECTHRRCPQGCLNSLGSFSCYCFLGFQTTDGGFTCVDIDECVYDRCEDNCTNTWGSYTCSCRSRFKLAANGISCIPDISDNSAGHVTPNTAQTTKVTASPNAFLSTSGNLPQRIVTQTPVVVFDNTSHNSSSATVNKSWFLICVLASVIPLSVLIFVTSAIVIYRCKRNRNPKHNPTADSYCWVSSGLGLTTDKIGLQDMK